MRSLSLLTLCLATIGAYANLTTRAPGGIEVSLSTPVDKVSTASEIVVVATVKNVGDKDLKVIKFGTVLDNSRPSRSFIVTKDEKEVPFTGIEASIGMDDLSDDDLAYIRTGENVTTEHNVSALYDFSTAGPGTFILEPVSSFQVIEADGTVETISDTSADNDRSVSITITDDVSRRELNPRGSSGIKCGNVTKAFNMIYGFSEAKELVNIAAAHLDYYGEHDIPYRAYFGTIPVKDVQKGFADIARYNWSSRGIYCESDARNKCEYGAWFYSENDQIHICPPYFGLPPRDSLCKDRTLDRRDTIGGRSLQVLADTVLQKTNMGRVECRDVIFLSDPEKLKRSEPYMCFANEAYINTKCH